VPASRMPTLAKNARVGHPQCVCCDETRRSATPFMDMKKGLIRIDKAEEKRVVAIRKRLLKAQQLIRKHVAPHISLVDELIAERQDAARRE
jgi:hypothetical protein